MSEPRATQLVRKIAANPIRANGPLLQRKCACGGTPGLTGECEACRKKRTSLQRKTRNSDLVSRDDSFVPPIVHDVLRSPGRPLDLATRAFMEPRFRHDFSKVRVHTDARAAESARAVDALAYTAGNNVVFDTGRYAPTSREGKRLLAHELTHTVQQSWAAPQLSTIIAMGYPSHPAEQDAENAANAISSGQSATAYLEGPTQIARFPACTPAAICSGGPVVGSAQEADVTGTTHEVGPRARRKRMKPARVLSTGHGGRALQLEKFLEAQEPGKLANLQGIFVDQDIAPDFEATTASCTQWINDSLPTGSPVPTGMAGATKQCTFVHDYLNQQALAFNTSSEPNIGGRPRERWRAETLETLIHETEHPRFEAATGSRAAPAGVTSPTCQRANLSQELSELAAMLSEFPTAFRAAAAETKPHGPLHQSLDAWFDCKIQSCGENIKSALTQMGCQCSCPEVDAFLIDTFNVESASWSTPEKDALHGELIKAHWGVRWPLHPSVP